MKVRLGDVLVQGRQVDDGAPRPRGFLHEEQTAVETRRLRGWFNCPLVEKMLKLLGQGGSPDGMRGVRRQGEWTLGQRRTAVERDLISEPKNLHHPRVHSPSLPSQPKIGQAAAYHWRGTRLLLPKTPPFLVGFGRLLMKARIAFLPRLKKARGRRSLQRRMKRRWPRMSS